LFDLGGTRLRPAADGGHIIEDEGTPLPQQPDLNFVGDGVTAADLAGKSVVTIPGGGGGPQAIKPIDIGVGLKHVWLYDGFFYSSLAFLLEHGYVEFGSGTVSFTTGIGKLIATTTNLNGGSSETATRKAWKVNSPLLKDDIFWRSLVQVQNNAGGAVRFAYVGLVQSPVENQTLLTGALDAMNDTIAFISSEAQNSNNWVCMTQDGGVRTLTNTTVDSRNTIKKMECRSIANGDIEFYIDDVLVATHSTNVPDGALIVFRCGTLNLTNDINIIDCYGVTVASTQSPS